MLTRSVSVLYGVFCILMAASACATGTDAIDSHPAKKSASAAEEDGPYANTAPSYDSNYTHGTKGSISAGNTPEDDARPGVYYFGLGVNAFQHKDYRFAVNMYQVAASWAYKPAEFNLGVMYARGQGIPMDLPRAMAWMTLAAERNDPRYVEAQEIIHGQLTKEQLAQANAILQDMKKTYGDEVALRRAKARWAEVRNNVTGSHVGFVGNLTVGSPTTDIAPAPLPPAPIGPGGGGAHSGATGAGDVAGADVANGATAYRQLRKSDNPYDPKFERQPIGIATVEPLIPVKPKTSDDAATTTSDDVKHNP